MATTLIAHLDALAKLDVARLASRSRPEHEIFQALGRTHLALGEAYASLADADDAALRAAATDLELKIRELRAALSKLPTRPAACSAVAVPAVSPAKHVAPEAVHPAADHRATPEDLRRVGAPPTNLDPKWVRGKDGECRRGTELLRFAKTADYRFIAVVRLDATGRELWRTELEFALRSGEYLLSQGTRVLGVDRTGRVAIDTEAEHSRGGSMHWLTRWLLDLETGAVLSRDCAGA